MTWDFWSEDRSAIRDSIRRDGSSIARRRASPDFGRARRSGNGLPQLPTIPDSAALVRFDLATRKLDTVTLFKTPKVNVSIVTVTRRRRARDLRRRIRFRRATTGRCFPTERSRSCAAEDYHVDWVRSGGNHIVAEDSVQWERLTDEARSRSSIRRRSRSRKQRASGQFNALGSDRRDPHDGRGWPRRARRRRDGAGGGGAPRDWRCAWRQHD